MFEFDLPRGVLKQIRRCDRRDLLDKLIGLSLTPEYQSNHLRILTLLQAALVTAGGRHRAAASELAAMLNGLREHESGRNEDPAEDVFVSNISTVDGDYLIFNGIYPAADYSLQRMLDAVLAEDFPERDRLANQCRALLTLSDAIARRCGFAANTWSSSQQWQSRWPVQLPPLIAKGRSVRFSAADLAVLGISSAHLAPFLLEELGGLLDAPYGYTALSRHPILAYGDGVEMPIPFLVSPALRLHLAHEIANGVVPKGAVERFHHLQFARWLLFDLPIRGALPMENEGLGVPEPRFALPGGYAHAVVRFDTDKLAHLVVVEAGWDAPPDIEIHETSRASVDFERKFESHLRASFDALTAGHAVIRGLTLVVYDSPGWNLNIALGGDYATDWYVVNLSSFTLAMLFADPRFNLLDLWKMLRDKRQLSESGIQIRLWPDMLNHWSIWRTMHCSFWPRNIDLSQFDLFSVDTSRIQEQVAHSRLIRSAHSAEIPTGEWQAVERWVEPDAPLSEYAKPIFFQPIALVLGELRALVETVQGGWWVATARPPFDPSERHFFYLLWQGATEWLRRLAGSLPDRMSKRTGPLEIRLLPVPETILDAPTDVEFVRAADIAIVTIVLPPAFVDGLITPDNRGEAALVRAIAHAAALAWDVNLTEAELQVWVANVTSDPALKMMHVTPRGDAGLALDAVADKKRLRLLQEPDLARSSRHLRDALAANSVGGINKATARVEGVDLVKTALNAAVDVRWARCREILRELDRTELLVLTSQLIEAVQRDRVDAERAALARMRLYADSPDIEIWAKLTMGRRDAAFRAYRVIAEMAICEAPLTGGRAPGLSDVDELAAEITLLVQNADYSDAVRFGLVKPSFEFLPDGSLEPDEGGAEQFMHNYLAACLGESVALDMDAYPGLYEEPGGLSETRESDQTGDTFLVAFEAEFGLSLADAARVSAALQHVAYEEVRDVVRLPRSVLAQRVADTDFKVEGELFERFVAAFGLSSRIAWDAKPLPPFRPDDVWPWYFERRLSLMLRPLLVVSQAADPLIVFGVRQLGMGVHYASTLLEFGVWPKEKLSSHEAKAYVDAEVNRRGDAFEREVAALVEEAGWRVVVARPMIRLGATATLGDLDVLAISPDGGTWIVIECKWFGAARTPREVASWIQDYRGRPNDKLDRHLKRHTWIDQNRDLVAKALGLALPIKVLGRIATTSPVPLAFTDALSPAATVWTRRELPESLNDISVSPIPL